MSGHNIVVADSDVLIGLINPNDPLHDRCLKISEYLSEENFISLVPYPIVLEAATALVKDKTIRRPDLAKRLLKDYSNPIPNKGFNLNVAREVAQLYNPRTSKKNSPFDFYVLALAKKNAIKYVFSFDSFYQKHGLILAEELLS